MEKQFKTGRFSENDHPLPPKKFYSSFKVQQQKFLERNVFTIEPKRVSETVVFYLHGGAYIHGFAKQHWQFVSTLINAINCSVVLPDYPLAPHSTAAGTFDFVYNLYNQQIINQHKKVIIIGDSSGGGIALALQQILIEDGLKKPAATILISPWLDVRLSNPGAKVLQHYDHFLSLAGLQQAGKAYFIHDKDHKLANPLYGRLSGLDQLHVFTGTHDILFADIDLFAEKLAASGNKFFYYKYIKMMHDWPLIQWLPEAKNAIRQIISIIHSAAL